MMERKEDIIVQEPSLKQLLREIFKGKWLIAIITALVVLLSGLLNLFVLPVQYQSKALLMANPINFTTGAKSSGNAVIDSLTRLPAMTADFYLTQITSQPLLEQAAKQLDYKDGAGHAISAISLAAMVKARLIANSNIIEITVSGEDPEWIAHAANVVSQTFIEYTGLIIQNQIQVVIDFIAAEITKEENNIKEKGAALADFLAQNGDLDVLKNSLANLEQDISDYQHNLHDTEVAIAAGTESLTALNGMIQAVANNTRYFSIIIDPDNLDSQIQLDLPNDQLSGAMLLVEITKVQATLVENVTRRKAISAKIDEMTGQLIAIQTTLALETYKYDAINNDLDQAQSNYEIYRQKYQDASLAASADLGKTSISVYSPALTPLQPISTSKAKTLIVAFLIGLVLGVFVVLFRNYWKNAR
jgi:polysaccharide biosynthesis transport protein